MIIQRFGDVKKLVEADFGPDGQRFLQECRPENDSDRIAAKSRSIQEEIVERMKEKFARLFARAAGGADRHAPRPGRRPDDREYPDPAALTPGRTRADRTLRAGKGAGQERTLNEAKATAAAQLALTQSSIQVRVHENEGAAALARAIRMPRR